jgi:hypothetical protein
VTDGPAKNELSAISEEAQKALGQQNPGLEVRKAVLLYFEIREQGEDEEPARATFLEELPNAFPKKNGDEIQELFETSYKIGESLWMDAFLAYYW